MGVYDELAKLDTRSPSPGPVPRLAKKLEGKATQPTDQSTDRSTNRPIDQSINWPTAVEELGPVVGKPRAFYITQQVDGWLDEAVRYLRGKDLHKADRSVVVNALLHSPDLFKPNSLDKLRKRIVAHLTNKSLGRTQSTDQSTNRSVG